MLEENSEISTRYEVNLFLDIENTDSKRRPKSEYV